jgi:uncharacterized alpha-E superfamily protein
MLSRVADHLYWMSRYLERAEHTARLIDVYLNMILDLPPGIQRENQTAIFLRRFELSAAPSLDTLEKLTFQLTFSPDSPVSILSQITDARENARYVREQISSEMWLQINRLYLDMRQAGRNRSWWIEPHNYYMDIKMGIHLFQGIADSTMVHDQGWHFMQIGRNLERIINLSTLLHSAAEQPGQEGSGPEYFSMLALLKSVTAFEAYCKVYNPDLNLNSILEFLLFNSGFPHSARFCIDQVLASLNSLGDNPIVNKQGRPQRMAGRLQSSLSYVDLEEVLGTSLTDYLELIRHQASVIHETIQHTYITYPIESVLN